MFRMMGRDLSGQFRADRAHTCYQHYFACDIRKYLIHICLDGISSQQIFNLNGFHFAYGNFSGVQLIHSRKIHQLAGCLAADAKDLSFVLGSGAWDSHIDLLNAKLFHGFQDAFSAAEDRNIVDISAPFILVIIDKAADPLAGFFCALDIPKDHLSCTAGTDEHDLFFMDFSRFSPSSEKQDKAIGKTDAQRQAELDNDAEHKVGNRHSQYKSTDSNDMYHPCNCRGHDHSEKL